MCSTFVGEYYRVTELDGMPKPVQQPVPFFVGGGAPKILALAGREAQIVGINANLRSGDGSSPDTALSMTPAATDAKVGWVRDGAGDRFDDIELQSLVGFVYVTDNATKILDGIAPPRSTSPSMKLRSHRRASLGQRTPSSSRWKHGANAGRCRTTSSRTLRSTRLRRSWRALTGK